MIGIGLTIHFVKNIKKNIHNGYLELRKDKIKKVIRHIFKISLVICPSNFVYNIVRRIFPHCGNIYLSYWKDIDINNTISVCNFIKGDTINIGMLSSYSDYKGGKKVMYLKNNFKKYKDYRLEYYIVDINIKKYSDNYESFLNVIYKYNIHGLLYLNKWGETWCYSLTKGLKSGLPIFIIILDHLRKEYQRIIKNI